MFGVVGMLVGVPVFAMIYRFVTRFMDRHLRKKGLPTEAYVYAEAGPSYPDRKGRRKLDGSFEESKEAHVAEAGAEAAADSTDGTDDAADSTDGADDAADSKDGTDDAADSKDGTDDADS